MNAMIECHECDGHGEWMDDDGDMVECEVCEGLGEIEEVK